MDTLLKGGLRLKYSSYLLELIIQYLLDQELLFDYI